MIFPTASIEILWEESSALVVNKPAGMLTQGAAGITSVETSLREFLKRRDSHPAVPYLGLPHRIDRPVSGALLVARNVRATRRFGGQFQSRKIGKKYWALIASRIEPPAATWIDFMRKIPDQPRAEIVGQEAEGARRAVLSYQVLGEFQTAAGDPRSLVEIQLETGRMHQIRLQFATRGYPLLGDAMYGAEVPFGPQFDDIRHRAIALHAREIRFFHPKSGIPTRVVAPLPDDPRNHSNAAEAEPIGWTQIPADLAGGTG
jgi:23S rRNA pseudouridine1911/1915/1917 synthase